MPQFVTHLYVHGEMEALFSSLVCLWVSRVLASSCRETVSSVAPCLCVLPVFGMAAASVIIIIIIIATTQAAWGREATKRLWSPFSDNVTVKTFSQFSTRYCKVQFQNPGLSLDDTLYCKPAISAIKPEWPETVVRKNVILAGRGIWQQWRIIFFHKINTFVKLVLMMM